MSDRYDRYLEDFGARLEAAREHQRPREQPSRRRTLGWSLVMAAVAAVVLVAVLSGSPAGRRLDVVAEARAALAPRGAVVHLRITAHYQHTPGTWRARTTEQWTAADPPRWRFVQTIPRDRTAGIFFSDDHGRRIVGRQELAYASGRRSTYDVELDRLRIDTGWADDGPAVRVPGPLGGDPATDLRAMLADGKVTDEGLVAAGGRTVRRLVSELPRAGRDASRFTYDVDPNTFAPVRGVLRFTVPARSRPVRRPVTVSTITFTVERYERIPLDAETAKLLTITTARHTKVTLVTAAERRRFQRLGRCHRRSPGGHLICRVPFRRR